MTLRIDLPECRHGTPGGSPRTCALCRHGDYVEDQLQLLPPGVRPMPRDFRALVEAARRGELVVDTTGQYADRPSPHDEPLDFGPAFEAGPDARTRQLPPGDR